jgi:5'-nucleotidase
MDFTNPDGDFSLAQKTIKELVLKIRSGSFPLPNREFLNINIPPDIKEAKMQVTNAGYRFYANDSHVHRNPRGEEHYWLGLHPLNFSPRKGNEGISDYEAIKAGNISVTPIMLDLSAYKSMDKLKNWL